MALNASKVKYEGVNKDFVKQEVLPAGVYPGRLVQIVDYGLQAQNPYEGQDKPPAYQIGLTYELTDEFMKDKDGNDLEDKPRWISEIINLFSLESERAKSTQRYKAFDPELVHEGDFTQLLGTPVNVGLIVQEKKTGISNKVGSIAAMRPRDAAKCPDLVNTPKIFSLDEPDMDVFNSLPDWVKEKIRSNLEYAGSPLEALVGAKPAAKKEEPKKEEQPAWDGEHGDDDDVPY